MKQKFKLYLFLLNKYYVITESLKVGHWLSEFEFKEKTWKNNFPTTQTPPLCEAKTLR